MFKKTRIFLPYSIPLKCWHSKEIQRSFNLTVPFFWRGIFGWIFTYLLVFISLASALVWIRHLIMFFSLIHAIRTCKTVTCRREEPGRIKEKMRRKKRKKQYINQGKEIIIKFRKINQETWWWRGTERKEETERRDRKSLKERGE